MEKYDLARKESEKKTTFLQSLRSEEDLIFKFQENVIRPHEIGALMERSMYLAWGTWKTLANNNGLIVTTRRRRCCISDSSYVDIAMVSVLDLKKQMKSRDDFGHIFQRYLFFPANEVYHELSVGFEFVFLDFNFDIGSGFVQEFSFIKANSEILGYNKNISGMNINNKNQDTSLQSESKNRIS
ncbi:hypothetical protein LXL04_021601 [Taraxacum kok-saghyz]